MCILDLKDEKTQKYSVGSLATGTPHTLVSIQVLLSRQRGRRLSVLSADLAFPTGFCRIGKLGDLRRRVGRFVIMHVLFTAVVVESDFVKYEGKFENHVSGTLETALGKVKLNVGGKGLVESQSSFGTLRKQEVDLQQLIGDALER